MTQADAAFDDPLTSTIVAFLSGIGIRVARGQVAQGSFLPGIEIRNGGLVVDPDALRWPGDLLHEAGHIAVTPSERRATLGEVEDGGGEEMAAIAWSYAAALTIGIDPALVLHEGGYKGGSEAILAAFTKGSGFGVPLLQWYGMSAEPARAAELGRAPYPQMTRWLR